MTNVTKVPGGNDLTADYTGTGGAPVERAPLVLVTGYWLLATGGGPMIGATASTGDWILVGLLVAWIVWVVIENHNGPWRSKKRSDDGMD